MTDLNSVSRGVSGAWDFWLSQHEISVPETIEAAVQTAFRQWLDSNSNEIMDRIADKASRLHEEPEKPE